jgi:ankyrin repeat protein
VAAYTKDVRHAKLLLEAGAIVDFPDLDGITPLGWTAISGNTPVAMLLLQYSVNIDNIDDTGQTCLSRSTSSNHHEIVRALVAKGASVRANLSDGSNLIHIIAEHADLETLHHLRQLDLSSLSVDQNHSGRTPLEILQLRADYSASIETAFALIGRDQDEIEEEEEEVWHDADEA